MSIGAQSSEIGLRLKDAIAKLRVARGAKPDFRLEWSREWKF